MQTVYIVPAWSDQTGQCRVVACEGAVANARDDYAAHPERWAEVGIMNSQGKLVCIESAFSAMKQDEPLSAGIQYQF